MRMALTYEVWQSALPWPSAMVAVFIVLNEMAGNASIALYLQIILAILSHYSSEVKLLAEVYNFDEIAKKIVPTQMARALLQGCVNLYWYTPKIARTFWTWMRCEFSRRFRLK